jgi:CDP-diacylglycerol--glycerol-3-phosphate 3-phosphatidyltransferase
LATTLFLISSVTDFFDGYIARKFNQESDLGSLLDLLADKILVTGLLVWFVFIFDDFLIFISAYLIILREILVSSLRVYFLSLGNNLDGMKPNLLGKVKTTIQMIAISSVLISSYFNQDYISYASIFLLISALFSIVSLQNYYSLWSKKNVKD